jgi:dihydroneopterin aldolase
MTSPSVLITGAAQRIGRAIALDFASRGWRVGLHCRSSLEEAEDLAAEISAKGSEVAILPADLGDPGAVDELLPACVAALGAPSCLVNNAAMFQEDDLATLSSAPWDIQLAVNLKAPIFLSRSFARHLPPNTEGNIVNIIDQRVWRPTPQLFSYAVSKNGLWAATRMLAQALAPRVRVNAIGPGPVLRSTLQTDEQFQLECEATLLRRGSSPQEIAAAIRFILNAPAMTGQMIALDGGQHLAWQDPHTGKSVNAATMTDTASKKAGRDPAIAPAGPRALRRVFVRDLELVASVGVLEHEIRYEQRIIVSADLAVRDEYDGKSDRLADVLDYGKVVDGLSRLVQREHVNLIETLAERIAAECLGDARVESVRVRIEKPDILPSCKSVGIEIERHRRDL